MKYWAPIDWMMVIIMTVVVGFMALTIYMNWYTYSHCQAWGRQMVDHQAWTQYIWVGKAIVPIFHPSYSGIENVCVEMKK